MKPAILSILVASMLTIATAAVAQPPTHLWSQRFGSTSRDLGQSVATDASGNVFMTGYFEGTVDFGGGALVSAGVQDIFVVKYSPTGTHLWSQRFGSTSNEQGFSVATDASGNVFMTGYFEGTVDFGGGALVSAGVQDIFVAKYSPTGTHLWSQRFGSTLYDFGASVATDASGNVFMTGHFFGTVGFGGGALVSAGSFDIVVAKYSPTGTHLWSQRFGSTSSERGNSVATDASGNVFVTGAFDETVNFGGGSLVSAGFWDIFVAKYDATGTHLWSQRFGSTDDDVGNSVVTDASGNVFMTGEFIGEVDFGGGALVSAGARDIVVARYSPTGTPLWSQRFGSTSDDVGISVATDASGNVIMTGSFEETVNFGGGALVSAGSADIVVAKYSPTGPHLWSQSFGGTSNEQGFSVATDASGNVFMTGSFEGTVDFGGGALVSAGISDIVIAKYDATATGVGDTPQSYVLSVSNFPNPFNPSTTISYTVPSRGNVTVAIFDARGARVTTLIDNKSVDAGTYRTEWIGRTDGGAVVSSGVYFARIEFNGTARTKKMVLLK